MKKALLLTCVMSIMLLCGCTGYREIDRGYIVTAIGLKKTANGTEIALEVLVPSGTAEKAGDTSVLSGSGKTEKEAYADIKSQLVKDVYFEHCAVVAIQNAPDKKQLGELLRFCDTLKTLSVGAYIIHTEDIKALFEAKAQNGSVGYDIVGLIKNTQKSMQHTYLNQIYQLQRQMLVGDEPQIPLINLDDDTLSLEH